jgi:hypothetical protein
MPRGARIDAADAVHHIMARGIEQKKMFESDDDRDNFLHRLCEIIHRYPNNLLCVVFDAQPFSGKAGKGDRFIFFPLLAVFITEIRKIN